MLDNVQSAYTTVVLRCNEEEKERATTPHKTDHTDLFSVLQRDGLRDAARHEVLQVVDQGQELRGQRRQRQGAEVVGQVRRAGGARDGREASLQRPAQHHLHAEVCAKGLDRGLDGGLDGGLDRGLDRGLAMCT